MMILAQFGDHVLWGSSSCFENTPNLESVQLQVLDVKAIRASGPHRQGRTPKDKETERLCLHKWTLLKSPTDTALFTTPTSHSVMEEKFKGSKQLKIPVM